MPIQYLSDATGLTVAVQIPIDEWISIKNKYPHIENINEDISDRQKKLLDARLETIKANPERLLKIDSLLEELDKEI